MTGTMMMLTYNATYLAATTSSGIEERALAFSLSGIAGIAGIWLGGIATDRLGADRTLLIVGTVSGGMAFWNAPAIQARLHYLAGPLSGQALALNTSGTYLGVSIGAAVGGSVLSAAGVGTLPLTAAGFSASALLLLALASRSKLVPAPAADTD